jgi:hypothetical protein
MKRILPLLADIGHGIIAVLLVGLLLQVTLSWHFIVGILLGLLPDIDVIPRLLRSGSVVPTKEDPLDHRDYLHFPLLFILVGLLVAFVDTYWGGVFIIATTLHFINDTWGTGDGIMWLWPISRKKYKWRKLDTWKSDIYTHTPKSNKDTWIDASYLQITSIALIEYATFLVALVGLILYFTF